MFVLLFLDSGGGFVLGIIYWLPTLKKMQMYLPFFLLSHQIHAPFHLPILPNSPKVVHISFHSHQIFHQFVFLKEFSWPLNCWCRLPSLVGAQLSCWDFSSASMKEFSWPLSCVGSPVSDITLLHSSSFCVYTPIWVEYIVSRFLRNGVWDINFWRPCPAVLFSLRILKAVFYCLLAAGIIFEKFEISNS